MLKTSVSAAFETGVMAGRAPCAVERADVRSHGILPEKRNPCEAGAPASPLATACGASPDDPRTQAPASRPLGARRHKPRAKIRSPREAWGHAAQQPS